VGKKSVFQGVRLRASLLACLEEIPAVQDPRPRINAHVPRHVPRPEPVHNPCSTILGAPRPKSIASEEARIYPSSSSMTRNS